MSRPITRAAIAFVTLLLLAAWGGSSRGADPEPPTGDDAALEKKVREAVADLDKKPAKGEDEKVFNAVNRAPAAMTLAEIGPPAKAAVPALTAALKEKDPVVRMWAAVALMNIDPKRGKEEMTIFVAAVQDKEMQLTPYGPFMAALVLRPANKDVVAGLIALMRQKERIASACGRQGMRQVGPAVRDALPLVEEALKDDDALVRVHAADALVRIDAARREQGARAVEPVLANADPAVRLDAAYALGRIDPARVGKATAALLPSLKEKKASARLAAAEALVILDPAKVKDVLPVMLALAGAKEEDEDDRGQALSLVAKCGTAAAGAEKSLRPLLEDKSAEVAFAAAEALVRTQPDKARQHFEALVAGHERLHPDSGTADLLKLLEALDAINRDQAAKQPTHVKEWVSDLTTRLEGKDIRPARRDLVRLDAVFRLADLGPKAKDAVPGLTRALDGRRSGVLLRGQAARALGQIGPEAGKAVPALLDIVKARDDEPLDLREAAAEAIRRIDPETAKKEAVLCAISSHSNAENRRENEGSEQ